MINRFNKTLLCFTCLLMTAAVLTSCDKNDDNGGQSDKIELLSFGPTGSKHGDTLKFIGHNLDKVTSIKFTGNAAVVTQANFKLQNAELIKVIVPQAAEKGYVTLTTPQGDIVTKTQLDLGVTTTVTSLTVQARPGENVTINGTYLNWVTSVTFAKNKKVTTFVSKAFGQLVVKIPDDAETGPLILRYLGTDSADLQTTDSLHVTLPVAVSFAPNPVKHQTNVTITGTNLDLAKKITLTGVTNPVTTFVSQSASQIVVAVPTGVANGRVTLGVLNSTVTVQSADVLQITGTAPPPTIALTFYDDAVTPNWNGWTGGGWGGVVNYGNTSPVRVGTKSAKIDYAGGYGSPMQLGGASINMATYTTFKISIYGTAGTAGKKVKVVFNSAGGYEITLGAEGQWNDYAIPISSISAATTLTDIWLQEFSGSAGFTIYVDAVGLN